MSHAINSHNSNRIGNLVDHTVSAGANPPVVLRSRKLRLPTGRGSFARLRNASATRNRTSSWSFLRSFSAERSTTTRYIASPSAFVDRQARLPMDGNEVFCVARVSARQHLLHPQGAPAFLDIS